MAGQPCSEVQGTMYQHQHTRKYRCTRHLKSSTVQFLRIVQFHREGSPMPGSESGRTSCIDADSNEGEATLLLKVTNPAYQSPRSPATRRNSSENCAAIATTLQEVHRLQQYITVCCCSILSDTLMLEQGLSRQVSCKCSIVAYVCSDTSSAGIWGFCVCCTLALASSEVPV